MCLVFVRMTAARCSAWLDLSWLYSLASCCSSGYRCVLLFRFSNVSCSLLSLRPIRVLTNLLSLSSAVSFSSLRLRRRRSAANLLPFPLPSHSPVVANGIYNSHASFSFFWRIFVLLFFTYGWEFQTTAVCTCVSLRAGKVWTPSCNCMCMH